MKCLVFGATGRTGQPFMEQALATGIHVTTYVRSPEKIQTQHANLTVVKGDAFNAEAVSEVINAHSFDAIVIAVAGGLGKDHTNTIITENVIAGCKELRQKPHIWIVSACGTGDSHDQLGFIGKVLKATMLRNPFKDHEAQEKAIRESGLPYTIARPVGLTDGELTKDGYVAQLSGKMPSQRISRANVAHFMLTNLTNQDMNVKAFALSDK